MIELYHNDMSVCAQKVRFALAEKKLNWQSRHLNLRAGDQQQPDYVKLNPNTVAAADLVTTQFFDTIPARPYPNDEAVQMQIDDLASAVAPKLKGAKAQEFIDVTILKELESEGFFAHLEKQ